ncbi:hypothetical protein AYL99_04252 [Fonsecaea erecta]|uniref:Uncharacterized protein n=1 Tax=Fonsecaea erecta TaxID=1367422 RepID=A0A178ZQE8_9EURO|nr:hypothetical protein AYL99_04252 [Fonsecaea erecta]OAP62049.1 hypothetical protein AYL99_04252 [Fonsecaea erecta]
MDHRKEQETGRQRMRDLFQQRELDRGSLHHKRIFKTPEEEAKAKQAVRFTPNAQARNLRELTATRGQAPAFDEDIWDGERRRPPTSDSGSVSPRTRVDQDDGCGTTTGKNGGGGNGEKSSGGEGNPKSQASQTGNVSDKKNSHSRTAADKQKSF